MFNILPTLAMVLFPYFGYEQGGIHVCPWFQAIAGESITVDNVPIQVGDTIKCFTKQGIYCGIGVFTKTSANSPVILKWTIIYGEDPYAPGLTGAIEGDTIVFKIGKNNDYKYATADSTWEHQEIYIVKNLKGFNPTIVQGDANNDGQFDIGDLALLVDHLFINYPVLGCSKCADMDSDNSVDVADLQIMVNKLFR